MKHERDFQPASPIQLDLSLFVPPVKRQKIPPEIRFRKMLKTMPNGCVIFTGAADHSIGGYGKFRVGNTSDGIWLAHRYAYFLKHGKVPDLLRHECNNPLCVEHTTPGTAKQNTADMMKAGRHRGKLKKEQVELIVKLWQDRDFTIERLAEQFNVSQCAIERLITGRSWSKVTGIKFTPKKPHQRKLRNAA